MRTESTRGKILLKFSCPHSRSEMGSYLAVWSISVGPPVVGSPCFGYLVGVKKVGGVDSFLGR